MRCDYHRTVRNNDTQTLPPSVMFCLLAFASANSTEATPKAYRYRVCFVQISCRRTPSLEGGVARPKGSAEGASEAAQKPPLEIAVASNRNTEQALLKQILKEIIMVIIAAQLLLYEAPMVLGANTMGKSSCEEILVPDAVRAERCGLLCCQELPDGNISDYERAAADDGESAIQYSIFNLRRIKEFNFIGSIFPETNIPYFDSTRTTVSARLAAQNSLAKIHLSHQKFEKKIISVYYVVGVYPSNEKRVARHK